MKFRNAMCMMRSSLLLLTYLVLVSGEGETVQRCKLSTDDAELEQCILEQAPNILKMISNGVPKLGLPSLNPLFLKEIAIPDTDIHLVDLEIRGLEHTEFEEAKVNYTDQRAFFRAIAKNLKIKGFATMRGYVYPDVQRNVTPLSIEVDHIVLDVDVPYNVSDKNIEILPDVAVDLHLNEIENDKVDVAEDKSQNNGAKPETHPSEVVDHENWKQLFKKYEPQIEEAVKNILEPIVKQSMKKLEVNDLFSGAN